MLSTNGLYNNAIKKIRDGMQQLIHEFENESCEPIRKTISLKKLGTLVASLDLLIRLADGDLPTIH